MTLLFGTGTEIYNIYYIAERERERERDRDNHVFLLDNKVYILDKFFDE
jgi:hypothetical protein